MLTSKEILDYELRASWWAPHVSSEWMQKLTAKYFANKVNMKFARYKRSKEWEKKIKEEE